MNSNILKMFYLFGGLDLTRMFFCFVYLCLWNILFSNENLQCWIMICSYNIKHLVSWKKIAESSAGLVIFHVSIWNLALKNCYKKHKKGTHTCTYRPGTFNILLQFLFNKFNFFFIFSRKIPDKKKCYRYRLLFTQCENIKSFIISYTELSFVPHVYKSLQNGENIVNEFNTLKSLVENLLNTLSKNILFIICKGLLKSCTLQKPHC